MKVLDHGYVELVETWGSDQAIIEAARMSTNKGFVGWGTPDAPGDEKLLAYLYNNKHATPFEMAGMVIEVKAPIFVFREWHRHRTQSYNEMSARYVPLPNENYVPDLANVLDRAHSTTKNKQSQAVGSILDAVNADIWIHALKAMYAAAEACYQTALECGVPKELARLIVPVGRYSRMRASANLRNWLAFLTLRTAPNAQWEIRQYANAVASLISESFPRTYNLFCEERVVAHV